MDFYLLLVVDKSEHIVTWDRMATVHELILRYVAVGNEYRFFPVQLIVDDHQIRRALLFRLLVFSSLEEWYKLSPSLSCGFFSSTCKFVDVFLTEYDSFLSDTTQEVFAYWHVVECGQLVDSRCGIFDIVYSEERAQLLFTLLLYLSTVASEYGLYFSLGLCCGHEVDP